MSEVEQLLEQVIKERSKQTKGFNLLTGTVKSIDGDTCTVDEYEDVRLNAVVDSLESQFTVYPKIGSKVIIGRLKDSNEMFVIAVSEIDKVTIKISDLLFEMKEGKFSIKNDTADLKTILNNAFQKLKTAIITTPSGPGQFSPADKVAFEQYNNQVNQLLS